MKHLSRMVFLSMAVVAFYACQKEETASINPNSLTTDAISKTPRDPYKGTRIREIRSEYRSFVISYNKQGQIDSINGKDNYPGQLTYKYVTYYTASRLDSVQLIWEGRVNSVTTGIKYKGDLIVQSEYWFQRPTQPYPIVRPLFYDKKKRLLNSNIQTKFLYNERGAIVASGNQDGYNTWYSVDYNINPLHLVPNFFLVLVEDYNIAEFWYNPYNVTAITRGVGKNVTHYYNQYNELGQLVKISWTENSYPKYLNYIYE